ncbi:MAG: Rid family detoxifying hydrolase [Synergistaceae bacterium]|nr:Rid family detoxifying hydrolase [Synergistaceae bacterium]
MKKEIKTDKAPNPIGPYSQGIISGSRIYVSGQGPKDPVTGNIPDGIAAQTHQALKNIRSILEAGGASMDDVVKTTVHLTHMGHFKEFNEIYVQYFNPPYPTRTTVQSTLPGIFFVEIDVIAELDS